MTGRITGRQVGQETAPVERTRRPANHSRAWVDAVVCPVLVNVADAAAALPADGGLRLTALPGVPADRHPVIVEIWRVHDGALETAELDAHDWSELAAAAAGFSVGGSSGALAGAGMGTVAGAAGGGALGMLLGPVGLAWGAAIGAAAGATTAAAIGATAGAMWGARWAAGAGRRASVAGSRIFGTYCEVLVTIPGVLRRRGTETFSVVAAMHTDSALSRFGERVLGFGYGKQAARIITDQRGHVFVETRRGKRLLGVSVSRQVPARHRSTADAGQMVREALRCPLLGTRPSGRLVVSYLDRVFDAPSVAVTGAAVDLDGAPGFLGGLLAGPRRVGASATKRPWGAFVATGLPVRLSYPRRTK
jgi:hypothetical protein